MTVNELLYNSDTGDREDWTEDIWEVKQSEEQLWRRGQVKIVPTYDFKVPKISVGTLTTNFTIRSSFSCHGETATLALLPLMILKL